MKLIKSCFQNHVVFWIATSIAEAVTVIPNDVKTCFAKEIATFINEPANLLTNDLKNPPDWNIFEIWAKFKSISYFCFCHVVNDNSYGKLFP